MNEVDKLIALAEEHDAKATKGPWIPANQVCSEYKRIEIFEVSAGEGGELVCQLDSESDVESNQAFIAASRTAWPATAKALKVAVECFRRVDFEFADASQGPSETLSKVWDHCQNAIAEIDRIAEGR